MLNKVVLALAIVAGSAISVQAGSHSIATANVNLRAGPAVKYPVVSVVPTGAPVTTHGCTPGYRWCDVSFEGYRGWVAARYLKVIYDGVPTVITPALAPRIGLVVTAFTAAYWGRHYHKYPWYRDWPRYYADHPTPYAAPPRARAAAFHGSGSCADGKCSGSRSYTGPNGGTATATRSCSGGECTRTREVVGPNGNSASKTRTCSEGSCNVTRTGPSG